MTTKLTLSVDHQTIERAKEYAHEKGVSVSKLEEDYLNQVTEPRPKRKSKALSELMKLRGVLGRVPSDFDFDEAKHQYMKEKYKL